jgi:hypothetical protein
MTTSLFYAVGKRGLGAVFIRTAPLRVSSISHETIVAYEAAHDDVDGYARIAAAAKAMMVGQDGKPETTLDAAQKQGIETLISAGTTVSDADFAFVSEVIDQGWDFNRGIQLPIESALEAIGPNGVKAGDLFEAILSDTAAR